MKNFSKHYELYQWLIIPENAFSPKKFFPLDFKGKKQCVFCDKKEGETSFENDAHIVPKSLGNRILLTLIECDECNKKNGRLLENQLVNDLAVVRSLSRKPTKKGHVKYKRRKNDKSYIKCTTSQDIVEIHSYLEENSIEIIQLPDENKIRLQVKTPPVNYVRLCKSLAKMGILLLPLEEIKKNQHIINWIIGKEEYLPLLFYKGFIPGTGLLFTILAVYKRKKDTKDYPLYIVHFHYSTIFYVFPLPTEERHIPKEDLLPDFPISPFPPHQPKVRKITVKEDKTIPGGIEEFELYYKTKHRIK